MYELNLLDYALQRYGITGAKAKLIRHNENMTYCIDDQFLLRIHKSKAGFSAAPYYQDIDMIKNRESELKFLEHLKSNGLYVQSPIMNKDNELVTVLRDGTAATLLTWLPGRTLDKSELSDELGYKLGEMLGKVHIAAKGYNSDYTLRYDQKLCWRSQELLSNLSSNERIDKKYYEIITNTLELIGNKLKQLEAEYIHIHSDLSLSNILVTNDGLVPIDFSLFGYSTPMLDFGSIYCFVNETNCRLSIVKGYEEISGNKINTDEIDNYRALQIILGIVLHSEVWINEDWFFKRLPEWCDETFIPLLEK
jgi:Ser/Thr protein kinase RdoA (MazF antagonist)